MSLMAWGMCSGIRVKILWVVLCTWLKIVGVFVLHGLPGVFYNTYAAYSFVVLSVLTWVLYKAIPLQKDSRVRSMKLLRASINLGLA